MENHVVIGRELEKSNRELVQHINDFVLSIQNKKLSLVTNTGLYQLGWLDAFRVFLDRYSDNSSPAKKMLVSSLYQLNKTCPWAIPLYFQAFFREVSLAPTRKIRANSRMLFNSMKNVDDQFISDHFEKLSLAIKEAGSSGSVSIDTHSYDDDRVSTHHGFRTLCSVDSFFHGYVTSGEIKSAKIIVVDGAILEVSEIHHILEKSFDTKQSIVLIARSFSNDVSNTLIVNWKSGKTRVLPFILPDQLDSINECKDICGITGSIPISKDTGLRVNNIDLDDLNSFDLHYNSDSDTLRILLDSSDISRVSKIKSQLQKKYEKQKDDDIRKILSNRIARMSVRNVVLHSSFSDIEKGIFEDRAGAVFSYFSRAASQGVMQMNDDYPIQYLPYSDAIRAVAMGSQDRVSLDSIKAVLKLDNRANEP